MPPSIIILVRRPADGLRLAALLALWLVMLSLPASAFGQGVSKSYQLRAVFLFRFTQFVEWPPDAFDDPDSPIIIGILGQNPFGEALKLAVKGETALGRPLQVMQFRDVTEIKKCHVLYISQSEAPRLQKILQSL